MRHQHFFDMGLVSHGFRRFMHAAETAFSNLWEECGAQEACIALHSGGGVQSIATPSSFVTLSQRRYFAMLNGLAAVPER